MKVPIKTPEEVQIMREGGKITSAALRAMKNAVRAGATTLELDAIAESEIQRLGAEPSFKKVPGYKYSTCMSVNDVVVHGLPDSEPLVPGDIVGIDTGAFYKGFHTDLSYSVIVTEDGYWEPGEEDLAKVSTEGERIRRKEVLDVPLEERKKFLAVGMRALIESIPQAKVGNHIGDISAVLQDYLEGNGYGVVRELIGHGVGKELHEPPQVPGRGVRGEGMVLKEGLVLAIEAIYSYGKPGVAYKNDDGWSIATADYSLAGLYEQTVAITEHGGEVLTEW
jgi:methionyl aminopeptidase